MLSALVSGNFVKLDQYLSASGSGSQEKIDTSPVRAGASFRINRGDAEVFSQDRGGAVYVQAAEFHLLYSFSETFQIARDRSVALGISRRQNIETYLGGKMQLEFLGIQVIGNARQTRVSVGLLDACKRIWENSETYRSERLIA